MSGATAVPTGRHLNLYVALIASAGLGVVVVSLWFGLPAQIDLLVVPILLAAMVASIWSPVRYQRKGGVIAFDGSDAILVALLFAAPHALVPALVATGNLVGNATRTREPAKLAFNFGAHALKAGVAALVFVAAEPLVGVLTPRAIGAVLTVVLLCTVIEVLLFGVLFTLLEDRGLLTTIREMIPLSSMSAVGMFAVGLLLAFIVVADRMASVFAFVLIAVLHIGFRGYALAMEERRRNERHRAVSRELADLAAPGVAAERYLAALSELFQARAVELTVLEAGARRRFTYSNGQFETVAADEPVYDIVAEAVRRAGPFEVRSGDAGSLGAELGARGFDHAVVAPLTYDDRVTGAIVLYDVGGLESDTTTDLLASLANEAAIAMKTLELFEELSAERGAIAEESRKLQDIIEAASDGIVLLDSDGRILTWNTAMRQIVGYESAEVAGRQWYMALRLRDETGEDLPSIREGPIPEMLAGARSTKIVELQVLRTDGSWNWVRCSFSPVTRGDTVAGVVLVCHDIHTLRETEELKADFVATVSHELRTPLTPLKGLLLTIISNNERLDHDQRDHIHDSMLRQLDRLEDLVSDLLIVVDLDRGLFEPNFQECDLASVADDVVAGEHFDAARDRIHVDSEGEVTAWADRGALRKIVNAVLSNAVKFTDGSVHVHSFVADGAACLSVRDEGPGLSPRDSERIFERFIRLGHHLTRPTQGSGLGLSVARGLAERMGGGIEMESEVGVGSTFTVRLPLVGNEASRIHSHPTLIDRRGRDLA